MKAATTIKGKREAEALEEEADDAGIDDDEVVSGGRHPSTTPTTIADVNDDEAMISGHHCPLQEGDGRRGGRRPHEGGRDHLGRT